MTIKLLLAIPLIAFFLYVLALPRHQILSRIFILFFVAILLTFALAPDLSTKIANYFGVGRGADFLFYISHLLLFFIAFKFYLTIIDLKSQITSLVQKIAINEAVSKSKHHKA